MNLEQLGKRDRQLESLLRQSQQWRKLDGEVKRIMPANLRPHFQTACVCGLSVIGCILADCQQTEKRLHILFYIMLLIIMEFYYYNVKKLSILIFPFYIFEQKGRLKTESCFQTALIYPPAQPYSRQSVIRIIYREHHDATHPRRR